MGRIMKSAISNVRKKTMTRIQSVCGKRAPLFRTIEQLGTASQNEQQGNCIMNKWIRFLYWILLLALTSPIVAATSESEELADTDLVGLIASSFTVDANGAARYSVPLEVPPARRTWPLHSPWCTTASRATDPSAWGGISPVCRASSAAPPPWPRTVLLAVSTTMAMTASASTGNGW